MFADGVKCGCEGMRGVRCEFQVFGLSKIMMILTFVGHSEELVE